MSVRTLLTALILAGLSSAAFAQQPSQAEIAAIRANCRADYQAQCASVPTGGPAALACLREPPGRGRPVPALKAGRDSSRRMPTRETCSLSCRSEQGRADATASVGSEKARS